MLNMSLSEVVFNLASKLTAAFLPKSDKIFRKASVVLIKLVGIEPLPQESHVHIYNPHESKTIKRKPRIRKTLQIHKMNAENKVRSTCSLWFESTSYQNFLQYHKLKYLAYKTKFNLLKNDRKMGTIQESEEIHFKTMNL